MLQFQGNVILVDTPGIGHDDNLDNIVLDFLPHAVSFVFVVNAKDKGGVHENKVNPSEDRNLKI